MRSIRRHVVTLLIAVLTLVNFLAALQSYRHSIARADVLFDADLQAVAASLLAQQHVPSPPPLAASSQMSTSSQMSATPSHLTSTASASANASAQLPVPAPVANLPLLAVQIWQQQQLSYRSVSAPLTPMARQLGFSEQNFLGQRWRVYVAQQATSGSEPSGQQQVQVAQPLRQRQQLADDVVLASIYPMVISLPLQALLVWLIVSRGLQPLSRLSDLLSRKKADDLTPIIMPMPAAELHAVLSSTNQLFARLDDAFAREKRFAADVAHELRTPLAALQANLHNAQHHWQQAGLDDTAGIMPALQQGVERMSGLIEQIMLLNRTNPEHFKAQKQQLDVVALCQEVIIDYYPTIAQKQQTIDLDGDEQLLCHADRFALRVLLVNLIGNAVKYTPPSGQILVSCRAAAPSAAMRASHAMVQRCCQISVEDSGPGIAPHEYQRVFDRFYRVGGDRHQSGQPGSGLGLAIVRDIVQLHAGYIELMHSRFTTGLNVVVEIPCA
jgi:two-component system sensor histidine kinase QseC